MTGTPAPAVVVTSYSIHLPADDRFATAAAGLPPAAAAGLPPATAAGLPAVTPGCPADQAYTLLGRKGLLYKEPATRLALCAAHRALGLPDGARPDVPLDPGTAVVAASNLGNVATVVDVTRAVAREGSRGSARWRHRTPPAT